MSYERQRATALRLVRKYGTACVLIQREIITPDPDRPWNTTSQEVRTDAYCTTFADDGVVFVDHNIEGDTRVATVVGNTTLKIGVGDTLEIRGKQYTVRLSKALDPDASGAILWAALIV